jgi:putative ABC transport system permease protein
MTEWIFARLLRFYPRAFRERYRDELVAFFRQDREHPQYGSGVLRPVRFWRATLRDLVRTAWSHRRLARLEAQMTPPKAGLFSRLQWDLRFAWRGLWAARGVTAAALAVLTIGIGASTSIFSLVDAVVLRGLPYPESDRLHTIAISLDSRPAPMMVPDYRDVRARQTSFEEVGGASNSPPFVTADDPVESINGVRITASLLKVLSVAPARGRAFDESDERPDAAPVALISDRLWRRRFNADPAIAGRTLAFKTGATISAVTVVGVMPAGFSYPLRATAIDLWVPFVPTPLQANRGRGRNYVLSVVGRLRPGLTLEQASAEMGRIRSVIEAENPGWLGDDQAYIVRNLQDTIVGPSIRAWMQLLLGAVAGVLLISCLNVANLLVARAVARAPELALRTALGASRWDLARALVVESVLLSVLGAAGGIAAAFWGVDLLRATMPAALPRLSTVVVDLRVMGVALSAAVVTGFVFGVLPAMQASRPDIVTLVSHGGGRAQSASRASRRIRTGLMVAEVAIAAVLVAGSALFLSSFARVASIDLGFDPTRVVAFFGSVMSDAALKPATTPEARDAAIRGRALARAALDQVRAIPGVVAAEAMQGGRPMSLSWVGVDVQHADLQTPPFTGTEAPRVRSVGPQYLDVIRGRLIKGRWIADGDVEGAPAVVVLGEEAARRYFGSRDPVGQTILMDGYPRQIVGVVAAMRWDGPEKDLMPEVFIPFFQTSHDRAELMVRTASDPATIVPALKKALRTAMPDLAIVPEPTFLEQSYVNLLAQRKFNMLVLAFFGIVAIVVASIGIYGLMAYVVAQRRREIGVRVALGAAPAGILRMVLRGATTLMLAGLTVGLGAALLLEQTVRGFLFSPQPHDPMVYAAVGAILFLAGVTAALGPARRAARLDPLIALRGE